MVEKSKSITTGHRDINLSHEICATGLVAEDSPLDHVTILEGDGRLKFAVSNVKRSVITSASLTVICG